MHFIIVDVKGCNTVISLKLLMEMNLIKRVNEVKMEDFDDVLVLVV